MSYRLIDANAIAESYPEVNDMPCVYADLPRGLDGGHYDMRGIDELLAENANLRELCSELLRMAESNDPDFLHWPEIHDELRKLGVKIVKL